MTEVVPGEPVLYFRDVTINFGDRDVLNGVSFEVPYGETKILLGESGSGKSVLLKLAAGLLRPDLGRVVVMGNDLTQLRETDLLDFRRNIGFVFQEGALFDSETVAENVAFRLREEQVPETDVEERISEALRFVEMEQALEKFPAELSGGMRRRVSIARALVNRPPLVLFDSPTAGLDPVTSQTIITLILRMRDLHRVTSMVVTHRLQDAFGLDRFRFDCDENRVIALEQNGSRLPAPPTSVLVLRDGHIYFEGTVDELEKSPDDYIRHLLALARQETR